MKVTYIATYPPRKCGIATFTYDLANAVRLSGSDKKNEYSVVALNDSTENLDYSNEVEFKINYNKLKDYYNAAEYLNMSDLDILSIQHDFGLYGGYFGNYLYYILSHIRKPKIITMHTILQNPPEGMRKVAKSLLKKCNKIVVMSSIAKKFLINFYNVKENKIAVIKHGIPDKPFIDSNYYKEKFLLEGKIVFLTFGLISKNKGLETAIKALPDLIKENPDIVYIIQGITHPSVKKIEGEEYRLSLHKLVHKLKLDNHVTFINSYLPNKDLFELIGAADYYITPYKNKEQIISGTLSQAIGTGKAIFSTPYFSAKELLKDGKGILFEFNNSKQLSKKIQKLMSDKIKLVRMRKKAYDFGRQFTWEKIGLKYYHLFKKVEQSFAKKTIIYTQKNSRFFTNLPDLSYTHLTRMTDETGLIQHANYSIPNRKEGYSSDDMGRALVILSKSYKESSNTKLINIIYKYLSFLDHAQKKNGRFHNFMSYDHKFSDIEGSEDTQGRVIWGLGFLLYSNINPDINNLSKKLFDNAINVDKLKYSQAIAYTIIGLYYYLKSFPGANKRSKELNFLATNLRSKYQKNKDKNWLWFETKITYGRAKICEAMIRASEITKSKEYLKIGLKSLDFLSNICINKEILHIIGNEGWLKKGRKKAKYDQQPIDAWYFVDAFERAYSISREEKYIKNMYICFYWFLGHNIVNTSLGNTADGSCCDGIIKGGINHNKGAESTLSFLGAWQTITEFESKKSLKE